MTDNPTHLDGKAILANLDAGVQNYLSSGGLFNPELMDHAEVSNLIIDSREAIRAIAAYVAGLESQLAACDWYWPENDTSSDGCMESPHVYAEENAGKVVGVSRGGVVETLYYATLFPDDDQDGSFEVCEKTPEMAQAKLDAEIARRELKDQSQ